MLLLRQSTAVTISFGPAVLNTDGVTLVTNLTGTGSNQTENTSTGIRLSKNGGAFAARHATAGASTYDAFGNYLVPLDTTDTNTLGTLRMQYANAAAFCPIFQDFMVINTALWDALCAGSGGAIPNFAANAAGGLPISAAGALDMDDMAADVDATETRVTLALPNAAPQAAGGLVTSAAGALDLDDLAADVDTTETRVVLALPAAAPQAAGGLITSAAGSLDLDEMNVDVEAIQAKTDNLPTSPAATGDAMNLATNAISAAAVSAAGGNKIADIVARRNSANIEASANGDALNFESLYGGIAKLTNKVSVVGANLVTTKQDGATTFGTQAIVTTPGADPITSVGEG